MHLDSNNLFREAGLHEELTFEKPHRLLSSLEIQVSEDQVCQLSVRQYDHPYLLALNFCAKYQLNEMAVEVIEKRIQQIIQQDKIQGFKTEIKSKEIKQTKKKPITSKASTEIGVKLYEKGLKALQKNEQIRVKTQMDKQAQDQKQLTFKPKLNEVSQRIVEMRKMIGGNHYQKRNNHVKKVDDEMQYCTFKPEINKESKKIVQQRYGRNEEEIVEKLYYDSVRLAEKKKRIEQTEQFTYKPVINQKSRLQVRDTFMQRLEKDKKNKKQKQFKSVVEDENCSFTPEIGRPPKIARNKQNLPIGDLLSKNYQTRSKSEISHQFSTITQSNKNKNSQAIYQNLIKRRVELLFDLLDGNKDGLISPDHIEIEQLSANSLLLLQPLFKEIEQMNAVLDQRAFTKAMMKLLEISPQHLKGQFISERWKKPQSTNYSFKPQLNDKSARLAHERSAVNLYKQGVQARKKKEVYTAILQARKQEEELQKCTFKPALNSTSKLYVRKNIDKRKYDDSLERMFQSSQNQDI